MFNKILNKFSTKNLPLDLIFEIDLLPEDQFQVRVFKLIEGKEIPITDFNSLRYGYKEEHQLSNGRTATLTLRPEALNTIFALQSLNPHTHGNILLFEIEPPQLTYFRENSRIRESVEVKKVDVSSEPLRKKGILDYIPDKELILKKGYCTEDSTLISPDNVIMSPSKDYVRVGKIIYPAGDIKCKQDVETKNEVVPFLDIPTFLANWDKQNDGEYITEKTSSFKRLNIWKKPLPTVFKMTALDKDNIQISRGYELPQSKEYIDSSRQRTDQSGEYIIANGGFFRIKKPSKKIDDFLRTHPDGKISRDEIPEFFTRDLAVFQKDANYVITDVQVITTYEPVVHVNVNSPGWLDYQIIYKAEGIEFGHELLKNRNSSYAQISDNTYVLINEQLDEKIRKQNEQLAALEQEKGFRVPATEFAHVEEFIKYIGGKSVIGKAYRDFINQLSGFTADPTFHLSHSLEGFLLRSNLKLRPYQRQGIHWMTWLQENKLHGALADDMGLGKTLQAICAMSMGYHATKSKLPSLIITPKSVLTHWEREIRRADPMFSVFLYHGPNRNINAFRLNYNHVIISTYDTISRDINEINKIPFFYLILDEATRIKNPNTKRSKNIKTINAQHRLVLSGTPIENRPSELWSLFDFLMRGYLGKFGTFQIRFEKPIINGDKRVSKELGQKVNPFILRRLKENVEKDLPPKVEITEWCELSNEQKELYIKIQSGLNVFREQLNNYQQVDYFKNILPILTKLKQLCDHPGIVTGEIYPVIERSEKFDVIIERSLEVIESGYKLTIFSQYLGMLDLLEHVFSKKKIQLIRIDGSVNRRQQLIDQFNTGKIQVALLSILAAGEGITLTAANHVFHADRWWNPAKEDQATDRVHRIGQKHKVFIHHFINKNTLEERVHALLEAKRKMANSVMKFTGGELAWTRDELLELLKPIE